MVRDNTTDNVVSLVKAEGITNLNNDEVYEGYVVALATSLYQGIVESVAEEIANGESIEGAELSNFIKEYSTPYSDSLIIDKYYNGEPLEFSTDDIVNTLGSFTYPEPEGDEVDSAFTLQRMVTMVEQAIELIEEDPDNLVVFEM